MTALYLFASTFVLVFALGLQSLNVNRGHYWWAFFNSFVIGTMQMVLLKLGPDASTLEIAAFLSGGPFGIVASMRCHGWLTRPRRYEPDPAGQPRNGPRDHLTARDITALNRFARRYPHISHVNFNKGDPKP